MAGQDGDDNVTAPIRFVDRRAMIQENTLGIMLDENNDMYTICAKTGIPTGKFPRRQFDFCPRR